MVASSRPDRARSPRLKLASPLSSPLRLRWRRRVALLRPGPCSRRVGIAGIAQEREIVGLDGELQVAGRRQRVAEVCTPPRDCGSAAGPSRPRLDDPPRSGPHRARRVLEDGGGHRRPADRDEQPADTLPPGGGDPGRCDGPDESCDEDRSHRRLRKAVASSSAETAIMGRPRSNHPSAAKALRPSRVDPASATAASIASGSATGRSGPGRRPRVGPRRRRPCPPPAPRRGRAARATANPRPRDDRPRRRPRRRGRRRPVTSTTSPERISPPGAGCGERERAGGVAALFGHDPRSERRDHLAERRVVRREGRGEIGVAGVDDQRGLPRSGRGHHFGRREAGIAEAVALGHRPGEVHGDDHPVEVAEGLGVRTPQGGTRQSDGRHEAGEHDRTEGPDRPVLGLDATERAQGREQAGSTARCQSPRLPRALSSTAAAITGKTAARRIGRRSATSPMMITAASVRERRGPTSPPEPRRPARSTAARRSPRRAPASRRPPARRSRP